MVMLPTDLANAQLKLVGDLIGKTQPVSITQKGADVLRDFAPGQRLMATIQSLLPDGTYRAQIAGRSLTLALPFAAQPGESLELETVEQNGKTTLAIVANRGGEAPAGKEAARADASASTTRLTPTGKLIAELFAGADKEGGKRPQATALNNAQPIFERLPAKAADIAATLKAVLGRSGMFYESHQVRWVQGRMSLESLLSEPQGRLSPAVQALRMGGEGMLRPGMTAQAPTPNPASNPAQPGAHAQTEAASAARPGTASAAPSASQPAAQNSASTTAASTTGTAPESGTVRVGMGQAVAPDLTPMVRQQLEALATNTYVWQGQVWPGQTMNWEIIEEEGTEKRQEENTAANWTTRLNLTLPHLGALEATVKLSGGRDILIFLRTENDAARVRLMAANAELRQRFETAGLSLKLLDIPRHVRPE